MPMHVGPRQCLKAHSAVYIHDIKASFPLRYFYGESANAIKTKIEVTLIANLILIVIQKR